MISWKSRFDSPIRLGSISVKLTVPPSMLMRVGSVPTKSGANFWKKISRSLATYV